MNPNRAFLFVVLTFLWMLVGCATNPEIGSLSSEQRARLDTMQVYNLGVDRPYKVLGSVKGLCCQLSTHQTQASTEAEAMEGLKLNAAILGADAIINTACQIKSMPDLANNCWTSFVCVGDAIKFDE